MKRASATLLYFVLATPLLGSQSSPSFQPPAEAASSAPLSPSSDDYVVLGASPPLEQFVHAQIRAMQPSVQPRRIVFVPHWKYLDTARVFRLRVPPGYTSSMFTHLPSRTVFIDSDRCTANKSLADRLAHELGHLTANSVSESDAEKAARIYRRRLRDLRAPGDH